jgi:hypothetical protein
VKLQGAYDVVGSEDLETIMFAKYIGVSAETAALIEAHRQDPSELEDQILCRALAGTIRTPDHSHVGCDLGQGAKLHEGERIYLFRYKSSRDARKPEAVAYASGGNLYLFDPSSRGAGGGRPSRDARKVEKSRKSLVQPALRLAQARMNDRNAKGEFISLDAWDHWFVQRDGKLFPVGELRDPQQIVRRQRRDYRPLSLEEL